VKHLVVTLALLTTLCLSAAAPAFAGSPPPAGAPAAAVARSIDINTASAAELETLPGIGPALAKRIVEHRQANGPFAKVDDLQAVKGVGPKLLGRIRDQITVSPAKGAK
jgi:competence protein ComEA